PQPEVDSQRRTCARRSAPAGDHRRNDRGAVQVNPTAALELSHVTRRYGALVANDDVSVTVAAGSIHCVVGENGAGKSTLLKIAHGSIAAASGTLSVAGHAVPLAGHSPGRAIELGLGMVHQHFMLVPNLTIVENVVLGHEPASGLFLDLPRASAEIAPLLERM